MAGSQAKGPRVLGRNTPPGTGKEMGCQSVVAGTSRWQAMVSELVVVD